MSEMMNKYRVGKSVIFNGELWTIKEYFAETKEFKIEHAGTYSNKIVKSNQI